MFRRSAALLGTLAVTSALVLAGPVPTATATGATSAGLAGGAVATDADLLAHYDFEALAASPTADSVVPDVSGAGHDATLRGAGATSVDGALTLPGGSAASGAAYVQLPTGLVDGQDTLTISAWLRNEKASGNYAALFFGTTENYPSQYWLLNPKNPSGRLKSVLTNGLSTGSPWTTEYGLSPTVAANGVAGPVTDTAWALYTTVIEPTRITGYLNGTQVGSVAVSRTVSQFGSDLVAYVGRSSYPDDLWKGQIRDLTVHTSAFSATDVARTYYAGLGDAAAVTAALEGDAQAIDLGGTRVAEDLTLPTTGATGSTITWATSDASLLAADGTVTRPTDADAPVTLTATLELAGQTLTRELVLTVVADNPQRNLELVADSYDLAITHLTGDVVLRTAVDDVAVTWQSSAPAAVSTTGAVTRTASAREVTLTATFSRGGLSTSRQFAVTVLPAEAGRIGTYIASGNTTRTDVLHLAASADGGTYTALLSGRGVLYPTIGSAKLGSPELFRKPDGTFGLVATEDSASSRIYLFDSADLLTYTGERRVTFVTGKTAARVSVRYDNGIGAYRLTFTAREDGLTYEVRSADLVTFSAPTQVVDTRTPEAGAFPAGALETASIGVTADEAARVAAKLGRVVSTGVGALADVQLTAGDALDATTDLPASASVTYSSGSTTQMAVEWDAADVAAVDTSTPGTYVVDGTVQRQEYPQTLIERRADPDVTLGDDGWYYFTASYPMTRASDPEGYDRVVLRRAQTIEGLADAPEVTIWDESADAGLNRYVWAPELTKIGDDWYVLFTAARTGGVWDIRPAVLKLTGGELTGETALDPASWTSLGQVVAAAGDGDAFTHFSLDMTYLTTGGRHYLVWAEKPGASTLRIGEIDPADPTRLIGRSVLLSSPTYAWESSGSESINEGPAVIVHDGKVMVAYSAATVDDKYCVGLLWMPEGADPMDPASWTKNPYPLLTTDDVPGQVGPGHNSFTVDELGNPVIVYHSRTVGDTSNPGEATDAGLYDPRRHARAATVHWDVDGLPVLAMTAAEELAPGLERVQVRVVVEAAPAVAVTATVAPADPDGTSGWYRTAPTVTLAADDAEAELEYRLDGGGWTAYDAAVTLEADGVHELSYRAVLDGRALTGSSGTVSVRVDRTAPTSTTTSAPIGGVSTVGRPVTLTIQAADATSGVDRLEYRVDGGAWQRYAAPLTFDAVGAHLVEHRAADAAGNVSVAALTQVVLTAAVPVIPVPVTPTPTPGAMSPLPSAAAGGAVTLGSGVVTVGGSLTVQGSGFLPGERVDLVLHSTPVRLGAATADVTGAFTATVRVPDGVPTGRHTLWATGAISGRLVQVPVQVDAPGGALAATGAGGVVGAGLLALLLLGVGASAVRVSRPVPGRTRSRRRWVRGLRW
ncbi:family 43 glycosylhydrolase [Cellulomonas soli]|uniref:family 43 glycosylhydrolase n=1 Tax=Cellulomonas soli TaxID=931535 RepID=UPI003F84E2BD